MTEEAVYQNARQSTTWKLSKITSALAWLCTTIVFVPSIAAHYIEIGNPIGDLLCAWFIFGFFGIFVFGGLTRIIRAKALNVAAGHRMYQ